MLIRTRLMLMGFGSTLLTTAALTAVGVWQTNVFHARAREEVDRLVSADLTQTTRGTYDLIQSQDQSISRQVDDDLRTARHVLAQHGAVRLAPARVSWTATNQFTQAKRGVVLPKMLIGKTWLGQNATFTRATPIVDEVSAMGGATVTIFQRMDARGDLLRVGTNVRTRAGRRAIGTFIPAVNPDGRPNPVAATVLAGRTYHGNAYVVNAWYVSDYQPLLGEGGRVIGALFTGRRQESAPALRRAIQHTRVGKTGAITILGGEGAERGRCRISPGGGLDGQDLWDEQDANGGLYVQRIVAAARGAVPGGSATVRYRLGRPGGPSSARVAQAAYYAPWDWVIVADTDAADFRGFQTRLNEGQTRMIFTLLLLGFVIAGGVGVVLYRETRQIAGAADKLAALATADPITGLPNHRAVVSAVDRELERSARFGRPCALLFLDIDHFKALNDGCGHVAGDAALAEFGAVVSGCLRGMDTVGRWGGEEFVALLPETDRASALALAETVRTAVASYGFRAGGGGRLTCSLGVAVFPDDAEDRSEMVEAADRAMYAAKRLGRNQARSITDPAVSALGAGDQVGSREENALRGEVAGLAALVAARDNYTGRHTDEVAALSIRLALALGMDTQEARIVGLVGQLHDVGKVAVPDAVLQKPGRLTEEEWVLMRRHPVVGADVVSRMPSLRVIAPSVRAHHERWDGGGYPDGLAGEAIPLAARIVAVADAYGAMTTDRPYRRGRPIAQALEEMHRCAGTQFDAAVVDALARTLREEAEGGKNSEAGDEEKDPALRLAA